MRINPLMVTSCIRTIFLRDKRFLQSFQYFSNKSEGYIQLKKKEFQVNPGFGIFRTTGNVDCVIKSTNPYEYPDADRAFVYIYGSPSSSSKDITIELTGESRDVLTVNAFPESPLMYCEVQLPYKYDLDVNLFNDAGVKIMDMENEEVTINTKSGNINTKGLKSHNIHITTLGGSISAEGTLQGNLFVDAKKTSITARKLQGMAMSIDAEQLDTAIDSSYMTQGEIKAQSGNIRLKNLHGCTDLVLKQGEVSISGLHGQIAGFLGTGNMDVQVTDIISNSTLHVSQGNLNISILDDPRHNVEVSAPSLEIASELKTKGTLSKDKRETFSITDGDSDTTTLIATVIKGVAYLKIKDWFSTLGIK